MNDLSPIRLWALRAMYLLMAVGIGLTVWPLILSHDEDLPRMTGVAFALLGTIGLLALLGVRHPVRMIPLLLVELVWKAVWLAAFALPRWLDGTLDEGMRTSIFETSFGALLLFVIPWRHVWNAYLAAPAEPWTYRDSQLSVPKRGTLR